MAFGRAQRPARSRRSAQPLVRRPKSAPKLLPLDIGLALHGIGVPFDELRNAPLGIVCDGRAAEMFVGQQLLAAQVSGALRSVYQFLWRAQLDTALRLHAGPLSDQRHQVTMPDGQLDYRLISLPLYLAETVPALAAGRFMAPPTER